MKSDNIIIADCGCPTPEWNTCDNCGACKDCCDCYGCDWCRTRGELLEDVGEFWLCPTCVKEYLKGTDNEPTMCTIPNRTK